MKMTPDRGGEAGLGDALVGLMGRLRERAVARSAEGFGVTLQGEADRFVTSLAEHLRDTEETLFAALPGRGPASALRLKRLQQDHRLMHLYARDLAIQIRSGDRREAYGVARSFLAVVMDHLRREAEGSGRFAHRAPGEGEGIGNRFGRREPRND